MAMMCGGVDTSRSRLHGRWLSDIMFWYLSLQHAPLCANIAHRMIIGGTFDTIPSSLDPTAPDANNLLPQAPSVTAMAATVSAHNPQALPVAPP